MPTTDADKLIERLKRCETFFAGDYAYPQAETCREVADALTRLTAELAEAEKQARHYPTVAGENMRLREELAEARKALELFHNCASWDRFHAAARPFLERTAK